MPWENTNAILYPRSQDPEFQSLTSHFGEVAKLIGSRGGRGTEIYGMKELQKYYKKSFSSTKNRI
jgi:hypothetical protein